MGTISIDVHQDENFKFFEKYDTLSKIQKKIWNLAVWWVKRFPNAHPNQATIAAKAGCRREHVNRTFALFKEWGWLGLLDRGRRLSKTLSIPTHLKLMDVTKREYFARIEITSKRTQSFSRYPSLTSRAGEIPKGTIEIPKLAQKLGYSKDSGLKLGLLPEYILEETLYQCKKLGKEGFRPNDEEGYFVGMAIKMAQNKGHKIFWPRYYQQRDCL